MTKLKTLAALIALALTNAAHADTPASLQKEFKAARGATITTMPAGVTLAEAQARLRAFLLARDSIIVSDVPGEIEARTPFAVDTKSGGSFQAHIMENATAIGGKVWYRRRVLKLSQHEGAPVVIQWCHKTLEKNVGGTRVPERIGCRATFAEWEKLREVSAALAIADSETGVVSTQGPVGEVLP